MIKYNLKIISLIISITGIFLLLIFINFSPFSEPKLVKISSINEKMLNKNVKIQGLLIKTTTLKDDFTALIIKDTATEGKIEAVCNCPNLKNYINQNLFITGKVSEYNNKLQIQVDKITLIRNSLHS